MVVELTLAARYIVGDLYRCKQTNTRHVDKIQDILQLVADIIIIIIPLGSRSRMVTKFKRSIACADAHIVIALRGVGWA